MKCINVNYVHKYLAKQGYEKEFTPQLRALIKTMPINVVATYIDKYLFKAQSMTKSK